MPEHLRHYWLVPKGPILCVTYNAEGNQIMCPIHASLTLHMTSTKELVTCRECLELLHA